MKSKLSLNFAQFIRIPLKYNIFENIFYTISYIWYFDILIKILLY